MPFTYRTVSTLIVPFALCVFWISILSSIRKPLSGDEVEFAAAAIAILETGKPLYYLGHIDDSVLGKRDGWVFRGSPKKDHQWGLWHSTFYPYLLAGSIHLIGRNGIGFRLPGVLCFLLGVFLLWRIARSSCPPPQRPFLLQVFSLTLLTQPFLIQGATTLDLDNTVVAVLSLFFLHEYVRLEEKHRGNRWNTRSFLWLTGMVALSFWGKETAPFYLCTSTFLYELFSKRWVKMGQSVLLFIFGTLLFVLTWILFCQIQSLPADYFLRFSYGRRGFGESETWLGFFQIGSYLTRQLYFSIRALGLSSLASSIYFFIWGALVLAWRINVWRKFKTCSPIDLFLIFSIVTLLVTKVLFPIGVTLKYEYPAYAPLLMVGSLYVLDLFGNPPHSIRIAALVLCLALAFLFYQSSHDPLLHFRIAHYGTTEYSSPFPFQLLCLFVLWLLFFLWANRPLETFVGATLISLLAFNLRVDFSHRQPHITAISTNDDYGATGYVEITQQLRKEETPNSVLSCDKSIGFHMALTTHRPDFQWIDNKFLIHWKTPEVVEGILKKHRITHLVLKNRPFPMGFIKTQDMFFESPVLLGQYLLYRTRKQLTAKSTPKETRSTKPNGW